MNQERQRDLLKLISEQLARLPKWLRIFTTSLAARARPARLALGVAPFVAKKNTPLDGQPFAGIKVIDRRMKALQRGLRGTAEVRPVSSRWAWVEHEISQGGPETGLAILSAWQNGGRFAHYRTALRQVDPKSQRPWLR